MIFYRNRIKSSVYVGILLVFFGYACKKDFVENIDYTKEILSFRVQSANSVIDTSAISIRMSGDTIYVIVPTGTDITKLTPEVQIKGQTVSPKTGVAVDFTRPVTYTVTAADGSVRKYIVVVSIATAPDLLYFGASDSTFYALNAQTGALSWKYKGENWFDLSSPTYHNGVVYVGSIDSYVYAFESLSGKILWKFKAGEGIESDAIYDNGVIYFGCTDDHLYAIDAISGTLKWKFRTGANVSSSPTILNENVFFGSADNHLYALNKNTGGLLWSYATGAMINQSGASLVNGVLYFGSRDGHLYAVDASTGTLKWQYSTNGISVEMSSPTVANGIVFVGTWYDVNNFSRKGSVLAVNANDGSFVWESIQNTGIGSSPCVADGRLYISADDMYFYALNAFTGSVLWRKQILPNGASATVSNGVVYVGGGGTRHIYAFDAISGSEKWRFSIPTGLSTSNPLIVRGNGEAVHSGVSGSMP